MQNAPRKANSGALLCWNYNAHSGRQKGITCPFTHDFFGGEGLRWTVESELLRRGGFRKRKKQISDPQEASTLIEEMGEKNRKSYGWQVIQPPSENAQNSWWQPVQTTTTVSGAWRAQNGETSNSTITNVNDEMVETLLDAPVWDGKPLEWEVGADGRKTVEEQRDPFFECAHGDLFNFDFTELETDGRNIFFIDDRWMYDSDVIGTS